MHDRLDLRTLDALALEQGGDQRSMGVLVAVQRFQRLARCETHFLPLPA